MATSEFSIIARYFQRPGALPDDVVLGVGDDAALLRVPSGDELVVTVDTLVEGVHFPIATDPYSIGHKALAVNLSDLAAMGARPRWVTLALTLGEADDAWLQAFAAGFFTLADAHQVALVGGDTTRGPLSVCVQAQGLVPRGSALRRDAAQPGDQIWVSGTLGDAALALHLDAGVQALAERLNRPVPRLALGAALRGIANSAIDISDGLLADLGHITQASGVGARIHLDQLPLSPEFRQHCAAARQADACEQLALSGGDDYELCFTLPARQSSALQQAAAATKTPVTHIGEIVAGTDIACLRASGESYAAPAAGYDHFRP